MKHIIVITNIKINHEIKYTFIFINMILMNKNG